MTNHQNPIEAYVHQYADISPEAIAYIREHMKPGFFGKGQLINKPGEMCSKVFLLLKGVVRGFIKTNGREVTTWVAADMELVTCIRSFFMREPSAYYMEALEDCDVLFMSYKESESMYVLHPETNVFIRKVLERSYCEAEERAYITRLSAKEKYARFMRDHSALVNRIPLKYIASFLGIRIETLSRIRNQYKPIKQRKETEQLAS